jgi:hypothetical protein
MLFVAKGYYGRDLRVLGTLFWVCDVWAE